MDVKILGQPCQLICLIGARHPATTMFRCVFFAMDVKIFALAALPSDMLERGQASCYDIVSVCFLPWMSRSLPGQPCQLICLIAAIHSATSLFWCFFPWMSKALPGQPCQLRCLIAARHPATTLSQWVYFAMDVKIFAWAALPTDMLDGGQAPCYDFVSVCFCFDRCQNLCLGSLAN